MKKLALCLVVALAVGCGGEDPTGGGNGDGLTQSQTDFIVDEVTSVVLGGLYGGSASPSLAAGVPIFVDISYTQNCPLFGRHSLSGNISGSIDDQGSGLILISATHTLTDCRYDVGGETVTVNGDPYLSLTGQFGFLNFAPSIQQTVRIGGGFRWDTGSGGSGSCQFNLTINFDSAVGSASISGTACGRSMNRSI